MERGGTCCHVQPRLLVLWQSDLIRSGQTKSHDIYSLLLCVLFKVGSHWSTLSCTVSNIIFYSFHSGGGDQFFIHIFLEPPSPSNAAFVLSHTWVSLLYSFPCSHMNTDQCCIIKPLLILYCYFTWCVQLKSVKRSNLLFFFKLLLFVLVSHCPNSIGATADFLWRRRAQICCCDDFFGGFLTEYLMRPEAVPKTRQPTKDS